MPLRPITAADLDNVRSWRNAPKVRENMYSSHEISAEEHKAWFERLRHDDSSRWLIYTNAQGTDEGVVYFTNYSPRSGSVFWGFYATPTASPGVGSRMEIEALDHAFSDLDIHKLNCEVLTSNPGVIKLHRKFGFTEEGLFRDYHFNGADYTDVLRLGLTADEWLEHRDEVLRAISSRSGK